MRTDLSHSEYDWVISSKGASAAVAIAGAAIGAVAGLIVWTIGKKAVVVYASR